MEVQDWGLIDYEQALKKQETLVDKISSEKLSGVLVFCTHPHIVTLGRKTQSGDVFAWDGPIKEVSRGGRATYHGPSQLLVYPIINLEYSVSKADQSDRANHINTQNHQHITTRPWHDIHWLLRGLENSIVETLNSYELNAVGKSIQNNSLSNSAQEETGVWVETNSGQKKIASLGIAIKNWVSYHGAAINLDNDSKAFSGMNPCGFQSNIMTNLEKMLAEKNVIEKVNRVEFQHRLLKNILKWIGANEKF